MRSFVLVALTGVLLCMAAPRTTASDDTVLRIGHVGGIRTLDPHQAASSMELHVAEACFEGLLHIDPETLRPVAGLARDWTVSEDGRQWTFRLRENARWSDGTRVTAADVARSFRRALDPKTGAPFAFLLTSIDGATAWHDDGVALIKLAGPRGLVAALRTWSKRHPEGVDAAGWMRWLGQGELPRQLAARGEPLLRDAIRGTRARWSAEDLAKLATLLDGEIERLQGSHKAAGAVFGKTRGVVAVDAGTVRIDLERPVPYLPSVLAMPIAAPVPASAFVVRKTKGAAAARRAATRWWKGEGPVVNGPFRVAKRVTRRGRDGFGVVLERNATFHAAADVRQQRIEVVHVKDDKENLRLFTEGTLGWATSWPREITPQLARTPLMRVADGNVVYYFILRSDHPALKDVRVRRALATALDRKALIATMPGLLAHPAETFVPPWIPGYEAPDAALSFDPEAARALLASAVPEGGASLPVIELVYNVSVAHREIAEFAAAQWRKHLGVRVRPVGVTWFDYGVRKRLGDYGIARAGWVGDFPDPLGFLSLFESTSEHNHTRWSDETFDGLLAAAREASDASARMAKLAEAEARLLKSAPCVPVYWYRLGDLVHPWVKGFRTHAVGTNGAEGAPNAQALHPFRGLWVERD